MKIPNAERGELMVVMYAPSRTFLGEVLSSAITVCSLAGERITLTTLQNMVLAIPHGKTEEDIEQGLEDMASGTHEYSYYHRVADKAAAYIMRKQDEFIHSLGDEYKKLMAVPDLDRYFSLRDAAVPEFMHFKSVHKFLVIQYGLVKDDARVLLDLAFSGFVFTTQSDVDFSDLCTSPRGKMSTVAERMDAALDGEKLRQYYAQMTADVGALTASVS